VLRVFVDSDVMIAGAASPAASPSGSASLILLTLAELSIVEAIISQQVLNECRRNLTEKVPSALPAFERLFQLSVSIRRDPSDDERENVAGMAHPKDLPLLAVAVREECSFLATFNTTDFEPGHPDVVVAQPGMIVRRIRDHLAFL
jgi:predicted nucleic acid-binding protein